ncbi:MAG: dephospho-CoA kinase [Gemmatimonadetes bacterium]|nr:dephospho-CoA kinase [Gemmatimonadota bacterium]
MLNIALTGNIASGKSTVVELFRRWGATVVDADELAREAQAPGSEVLAAIARRFGADVLAPNGSLDRPALRAKVMGDDPALAALNAIVHPAVQRRREELHQAAEQRGDLLLVNDIPLLFEVLDPSQFDVVVLVDAPVALRRTRLRTLRDLSNEDSDRMIASQMPAERKRPKSHFVVDNDGTLEELEAKARLLFEDLRRRAAERALEKPGAAVLLATGDGKEAVPALEALEARYRDAGAEVRRVTGKAPSILRAIQESPTDTVVAVPQVADAARQAWTAAGKPGALFVLGEPGVPLDLRPWAHERVTLNPLP